MTKGQRIKLKREELNIPQTDLARRVNISKQTLYKYENDIITNIPYDKIVEIANVLGVSPAYIFGWEETVSSYVLDDKARELYTIYEGLSPEKQAAFVNYLRFLQSDT